MGTASSYYLLNTSTALKDVPIFKFSIQLMFMEMVIAKLFTRAAGELK
jgi:hypothetical protein